jgi:ArsR family transcriptional regulator
MHNSTSILVDQKKVDRAAEILRALSHPLRIRLLAFIDAHKEINVNKIYGMLKLEQSITSQNLKILRNAGLVNAQRKGKYIFYSVNYENAAKYIDAIDTLLGKQ